VQKVADDAQNVDFYQRVLTLWHMFLKKNTYSFSMLKSMLLVDSFSLIEEVLV
jgi:hypothetical protein